MPENDMARYGEVKDLLGTLLNAAESKLSALVNEATLTTQYEQVLDVITQNLTEFDRQSEELRNKTINNIEDYIRDLDNALSDLGLNKSQEVLIQSKTKELLDKANAIFFESLPLDEKLKKIQDAIYNFSNEPG